MWADTGIKSNSRRERFVWQLKRRFSVSPVSVGSWMAWLLISADCGLKLTDEAAMGCPRWLCNAVVPRATAASGQVLWSFDISSGKRKCSQLALPLCIFS